MKGRHKGWVDDRSRALPRNDCSTRTIGNKTNRKETHHGVPTALIDGLKFAVRYGDLDGIGGNVTADGNSLNTLQTVEMGRRR